MTEEDRRSASLAAAFAPNRAPTLVARLSGAVAREVVAHVARLAAARREERLRSLSEALAVACDPASVEAAAAQERPAVAAVLRALSAEGCMGGTDASPALVRLCRERLGR